ncbi:MAG: (d)CMP kinase [Bdellovibrionaceae bacterium]|nr:(d)CMP kinase [Pseudobdellovibrionaceae bacterium]
MGLIVTIDGPAASGKSSVSRELARRLGWKWVSTGAFYRGLALVALKMQIDFDDVPSLVNLATSEIWFVQMDPEVTRVIFRGEDVTEEVGHEDVGSFASRISLHPEVRKALLQAQRSCGAGSHGLVAEGRDCGTVVFPQAEAKVYLTAQSELRAARRAAERGEDTQKIVEAQKIRDQQDLTRKAAPLAIPENALIVDTSTLNLKQVVDKVEQYVRARIPGLQ